MDEMYMRRCLQLARGGQWHAKPNPMVGAVIVSADGRIIGEGYHVRCGEAHAEVNAFGSVRAADERLLAEATIYVSLEPCSHWGKTPPCADLIVKKGVRRVVCGCVDPYAEVRGRGIERIRQAGIPVIVGVLERECLALNRKFIVVSNEKRPYIILKWAQTANHKIAYARSAGAVDVEPLALSSSFTKMLVHKLRAENDAILVGRETVNADHPRLNVRLWSGPSPERLVLTHNAEGVPSWFKCFDNIGAMLDYLYANHRQSLIVEGGTLTLNSFIERGLWDEIRVETASFTVPDGVDAPELPANATLLDKKIYDKNTICQYVNQSQIL